MPEKFYITAIDGKKVFFVAGPYAEHETALANVAAVRELGHRQNPMSWFFAWGTSGTDEVRKTPLGTYTAEKEAA